MGQLSKNSIDLIETKDDAKNYKNKNLKKLAFITQTTLSVDDTAEIIEILKKKFPDIKSPVKEDICYATTNRQLAVKKIAPLCDMFFIVGSKNSSNSLRLVEVAKRSGCPNSELISSYKALPLNELKKCKSVGISSGASAPEELVIELIDEIKKYMNVKINQIEIAKEKVNFKIPNKLQ